MSKQHHFIPNTDNDRHALLQACGVTKFEDLLAGVPKELIFKQSLHLGAALSEWEISKLTRELLANSRATKGYLSFLGAGVYEHICPEIVNHLTSRGEFLTSYTPYQPEMAQGTLQSLFEFQTMIAEIYGMDVSNASHYDGSTALTEGILMALRINSDKKRVLLSQGIHPEYIEVAKTYLANFNVEVSIVPLSENGKTSIDALRSIINDDVAVIVVQSPNIFGVIEDQDTISSLAKKHGALFNVSVIEPLSLGVLNPPGHYGADIATGEGQSFGIPQCFGGPYVGLFTAKSEYVRQMPGRLCGETVDAQGRRSYALTLSTREQHIRREKATSNICSNQNLMTIWANIWLSLVGKVGFTTLAEHNLSKTEYAKERLSATGKVKLRHPKALTFNEFVVDVNSMSASKLVEKLVARGVAPGLCLSRFFPEDTSGLLVCVTETKSKEDIDLLCSTIKELG